ncbi:sulfite exporter TauE/SafE family protein [Halomicrobium sp. LC1Hm]|uniref:sulfite exporter TauE/SafE family protein n=1 Tax=Halomicrobium sp. LC1Hm TaxID=2610902 RepID=UPI00129835D3|nr:sulfite exporter TauE/SafE family protein [Halomicrobium sp. LC1Hm]QGA84095.1 Sulfite exporter, TauE/SafE family [Halomicrobium sp. LC1Hm]
MEVPVSGNRFVALGVAGAGAMAVISGQLPPTGFPVDQFLAHWWVFPTSIVFATVALSSGVSGALFFSPFFMLVVGLTPSQAIGAGLLTEVFGMGNGLRSYVKQRVVDFQTAKYLLAGSVPAIVVGAFAAHYVDPTILKIIFGAGLLLLGGFLVYYEAPENCEPGECEGEYLKKKNSGRGSTTIESADGETFTYDTCWRAPGVALSTIGGFITGLISAGLPEIVTTQLIVRCRIPPRVAVATSVFVLGVTAVAGAVVHALTATPVWYVVAWSIPGVLVGGTIGTRVGKYLPSELMETGLGVVFGIVGTIVLGLELLV